MFQDALKEAVQPECSKQLTVALAPIEFTSPAKRNAADSSNTSEKRSRCGEVSTPEAQHHSSPSQSKQVVVTPNKAILAFKEENAKRPVPRLDLERLACQARADGQEHTPSPCISPQLDHDEEGESEDELAGWSQPPHHILERDGGKGHVYRPVSSKEVQQYEKLLSELQPSQAEQVVKMWDAMHQARQSCEYMTNRGVRASRDVLVGWTNITSDLTDRAERSDQQVQELLLLVQAQASTIDELQTKLVNNSPRPHGMEVEEGWNNADVFEQLQEQLLVNAKLSSLNAELVQKLDLVVLKTRSDSAKLVGLLEQSKARSSWLEQQHRDAGCSKQRDQKPLIQTHTQGRYGGISSNSIRGKGEPMHSRHTPASQPYVPTAIHASNNSTSSQEDQEQALFNAHRQRHTHAGAVVGLNRPSEWASPGSVLGKEYQRTAFRALLRRGGIM